jgi:hypothetical protein
MRLVDPSNREEWKELPLRVQYQRRSLQIGTRKLRDLIEEGIFEWFKGYLAEPTTDPSSELLPKHCEVPWKMDQGSRRRKWCQ